MAGLTRDPEDPDQTATPGTRRTPAPTERCVTPLSLLMIIMLIFCQAHGQGARKALATKWSTPASLPQMMFPGSVTGDSSLLNPETPSKSLLGATDNSIMFSPLSVSKVSVIFVIF